MTPGLACLSRSKRNPSLLQEFVFFRFVVAQSNCFNFCCRWSIGVQELSRERLEGSSFRRLGLPPFRLKPFRFESVDPLQKCVCDETKSYLKETEKAQKGWIFADTKVALSCMRRLDASEFDIGSSIEVQERLEAASFLRAL